MHVLSKPVTIYLIRHAESTSNAHGNIIGGVDATLTPKGEDEAHALMTYLMRHPILGPKRVFDSTMPRAMQTGERVALGLGVAPKDVVHLDDLREIARGDWEKKPRDVIYNAALQAEMNFFDMDHRAPNGESMHDVGLRARRWLYSLNEIAERENITTFIAVSHGIWIKALLQRVFGFDPAVTWLINIWNTSITKIDCDERGWHLRYLNRLPHLDLPL